MVPQHAMTTRRSIQRKQIIRGDPLLKRCAEEAQLRISLETYSYLPRHKLETINLVTGHFEIGCVD